MLFRSGVIDLFLPGCKTSVDGKGAGQVGIVILPSRSDVEQQEFAGAADGCIGGVMEAAGVEPGRDDG